MSDTPLYPRLYLRVSQFEFRQFEKLKDEHNMSAREVLEALSCPCPHCKNQTVQVFDRATGDPIEISRSIFSRKERT